MTVLVNICLAVCYGAYVCYLAVLDCECELCNCSITVGSHCLLQAVLAVLEVFELSVVAVDLNRLCALCSCVAAVDLYSLKSVLLVLCCEYESCLACRLGDRFCTECELIEADYRSVLDCYLLAVLGLLCNTVRNCAYVCYETVLYCECKLRNC